MIDITFKKFNEDEKVLYVLEWMVNEEKPEYVDKVKKIRKRYYELLEVACVKQEELKSQAVVDFIYDLSTLMELVINLYGKYFNRVNNKNKYVGFSEQFIPIAKNDAEINVLSLDWLNEVKKMRGYITHEGEELDFSNGNFQKFRDVIKRYPQLVVDEILNDDFIPFTQFAINRLYFATIVIRIITMDLINSCCKYKFDYINKRIPKVHDDYNIDFELLDNKRSLLHNEQRTIEQRQRIEFLKLIEFYTQSDSSDQLKNKVKNLNKLVTKIENEEFDKIDIFYISEVYYNLGTIHMVERNFIESKKNYNLCLKYNGSISSYGNLIKLYLDCKEIDNDSVFENGEINQIIEQGIFLVESLERKGEKIDGGEVSVLLMNAAIIYFNEFNNFEAAFETYKQAYNYYPNPDILYSVGRICKIMWFDTKDKKYLKFGIIYLEMLKDQNPKDAEGLKILLELYIENEEISKFKKCFLQVFENNPNANVLVPFFYWILRNKVHFRELLVEIERHFDNLNPSLLNEDILNIRKIIKNS